MPIAKKSYVLVFVAGLLASCSGANGKPEVAQDYIVHQTGNCIGNLDNDGQPIGPLREECL